MHLYLPVNPIGFKFQIPYCTSTCAPIRSAQCTSICSSTGLFEYCLLIHDWCCGTLYAAQFLDYWLQVAPRCEWSYGLAFAWVSNTIHHKVLDSKGTQAPWVLILWSGLIGKFLQYWSCSVQSIKRSLSIDQERAIKKGLITDWMWIGVSKSVDVL